MTKLNIKKYAVHIITQGCSANVADSEIMAGLLIKAGHSIADSADSADIIIFNTCTVKGPTETLFRKKLKQFDELGKKVIIAGCIPQSEKNKEQFTGHTIVGTYEIHNIVEAVEQTLDEKCVELCGRENKNRLNIPKIRRNPLVEIVPICHGCKGSCAYCKTKYARGDLFSYPSKDIVRQISKAVDEGVKEIWLSSQDDGAYGLDIGTNLPNLLKEIISIPKDFKVRIGMSNPDFIPGYIDELIECYKSEKIYKFLHIPVQAGDNQVLKDMKRNYDIETYKKIVRTMKKKIPNITIATDIICGYPTESSKQFESTIKLIKETKPDIINISRFWPRPGTPAAKISPPMDAAKWGAEVKYRTVKTTEFFHKIAKENNKKWKGWQGEVLVIEKGKKKDTFIGRNFAYKQVILSCKKDIIGKQVLVKIKDYSAFDLKGHIVNIE